MRRTVTILAPAYNEAPNIEGAVLDAVEAASDLDDYEIIVVDDGSTDGTGEIADRLATEIPKVRVIHHPHNMGIGAAYRSALEAASMEYITWTGGDRELHKEGLRHILSSVGAAAVVIPYYGPPDRRPLLRRILTWGSTAQVNLMFGLRLRYYQGPAIMPTAVARSQPKLTNGFYFATERLVYALLAGNSWHEIPMKVENRVAGRSKAVSFKNVLRAERVIWRLWWRALVLRKHSVAVVQPDQASAASV